MKKIIALLLLVLMVFSMAACGTTETPETTAAKEIMQKSDPAEDDVFNLLMVGHSGCYYYTEELYNVAKAAGVKMRVCNVYYSGCPLEKHWTWWQNGEAHYEFFVVDDNGKQEFSEVDLKFCMEQYNWDAITLMENSAITRKTSGKDAYAVNETYIRDLFGYFKEQYPMTEILWNQAWAYQVGYDGTLTNGYVVDTAAEQAGQAARRKEFAMCVVDAFDVRRVPGGDAWQIVRTEGGYDNLCARLNSNQGYGDNSHDGDIGGGQYLNACVWFETLTGISCVGNTYRPRYTSSAVLSAELKNNLMIYQEGLDYMQEEELITMLQNAAHKAVTEMK